MKYWLLGVNPEPWTPGTAYRAGNTRKVGIAKDGKLAAFQDAVRDEFTHQNPTARVLKTDISLIFYFWRSSAHGQRADATNLQKALEDALQGVLYANDRTNRDVRSVVVEQSPTVTPAILVEVNPFKLPVLVPPAIPAMSRWANSDWVPPDEDAL